jgi:hypothetical protein
MPGPIFISDVEQVSQVNFPIEPSGQATYVARPSVTQLTNYLGGLDSNYDNTPFQGSGGVPAGVESSSAITFPVTLTGSNNVLSVKNISTASFTNVTIATGTYVNMAALVAAVNLALAPTGLATAAISSTGTLLIIQSTVVGVGSYIAINTTVGGSTFNTPANFASGGVNFTMPTAAAIIAGLLPVGGPLNVSSANVLTYLGAAPAATGAVSLIAPHFTETTPVIQSFQIGVMSKFLEASYNPDPTLLPALANGAAITCVMDDGMTAYTAPLPIISSAAHSVPNPGDITITGSDLGNSEFFGATTVRVTGVSPAPGVPLPFVKLGQKLITNTLSGGTQGSVSPTSIVIPASLLTTTTGVVLGVAGSTVEVQFTTLKNGNYGSVANIASAAVGAPFINGTNTIQNNLVVTLTGLANMTSSAVGQPITISGAASAGNNGTFIITAVLSSSSVTINNSSAVAPDANNSHILWSQGGPVQFPVS